MRTIGSSGSKDLPLQLRTDEHIERHKTNVFDRTRGLASNAELGGRQRGLRATGSAAIRALMTEVRVCLRVAKL